MKHEWCRQPHACASLRCLYCTRPTLPPSCPKVTDFNLSRILLDESTQSSSMAAMNPVCLSAATPAAALRLLALCPACSLLLLMCSPANACSCRWMLSHSICARLPAALAGSRGDGRRPL